MIRYPLRQRPPHQRNPFDLCMEGDGLPFMHLIDQKIAAYYDTTETPTSNSTLISRLLLLLYSKTIDLTSILTELSMILPLLFIKFLQLIFDIFKIPLIFINNLNSSSNLFIDFITRPLIFLTNILKDKKDITCISPLHFLTTIHRNEIILALIDSGSQINLVHDVILPLLQFVVLESPCQEFRGAHGSTIPITKWIEFKLLLSNGYSTDIKAATTQFLPCSILLGQPFLISNDLTLHPLTNSLLTPKGVIKLYPKMSVRPLTLTLTLDEERNEEEILKKEIKLDDSLLTDIEKEILLKALKGHRPTWEGKSPSRVKHIEHRIRVDTTDPIRDRPRHYTAEQNEEVVHQIRDLLYSYDPL